MIPVTVRVGIILTAPRFVLETTLAIRVQTQMFAVNRCLGVLAGAILLLSFCQSSHAAEWFETEPVACSGLDSVKAALDAILPPDLTIFQGAGVGMSYVTITAPVLHRATDQISRPTTISAAQATDIEAALKSASDAAEVPLLVKIGTSVATGLRLPARTGTLAGLLFGIFYDEINAEPTRVRAAAAFIAEGGEIYHRSAMMRREINSALFLSYTTEYRVSVGKETRTFILSGCLYAAKLSSDQFHTISQFNNKLVKRVHGNMWRLWDVEDQKFEGEPWTYLKQADGFFWFDRNSMENGIPVGKDSIRLSMFGGAWELRSFANQASGYRVVYPSVVVD